MDNTLWQTYIQLQTEIYGNSTSVQTISDDLVDPIDIPTIPKNLTEVLIIGPGGRGEVLAWRKLTDAEIFVLTLHPLEIDVIKDLNIISKIGDIHDIPFSTNSFSVVFASQVLEHTVAPYIALMECRRVLKDDGYLVFTVPSFEGMQNGKNESHISCLQPELWKELLRKTGFMVEVEYSEAANDSYYFTYTAKASIPYGAHKSILDKIKIIKENYK